MAQYQVTFHYSLVIDADDERDAENSAYAFFTEKLIDRGLSARDFPAVTEEVQ
jgi:hypothetical protein